jgi:hypothetical protein
MTHIPLWQAVLRIDVNMPAKKPFDAPWPYIPSAETIKQAIKETVFTQIPLN